MHLSVSLVALDLLLPGTFNKDAPRGSYGPTRCADTSE